MQTKNMTTGRPLPMILKFALPLMAGNLFQEFYTLADMIIVGQFLGVNALAAVGITGWIIWMLLAAVQGFSQGFSIPAAQAFGAGDMPRLRKSLANSLLLSAIMSVVLGVLGQLILHPLLTLMKTPDEIFPTALAYLRIYYAGCPILMAFNFAASHLRVLGNSSAPLRAMIIASLTNIGLDLLFVGPFGWGVPGAVIATLIAQLVAAVYALRCLFCIDCARIPRRELRIDPALAKRQLRLGTPMSLQNIIISIGGFIVQSIVNRYSIAYIAGFTATNRLYGLIETCGLSYGYAVTTYVGQNNGAGEHRRIREGTRSANIIAVVTSLIIGLAAILFGEALVGLFISGTPQEIVEATHVAYRYLCVMAALLPILYVLHILRSAIVGMGNSTIPMLSGFGELAMRVGASLLLSHFFGEMSLFFAEPIAWLGADVVLIIGYYWCVRRYLPDTLPEKPAKA